MMQVWIQPFFGWVEIQVFKAFPTAACLQYELFAVKVRHPCRPFSQVFSDMMCMSHSHRRACDSAVTSSSAIWRRFRGLASSG